MISLLAVGGRDRDTDADADVELLAVDFVWLVEALDDAGPQSAGILGAADIGLHNGEFVATEAGHEVALVDAAGEPVRNRPQELVADRMTERSLTLLNRSRSRHSTANLSP